MYDNAVDLAKGTKSEQQLTMHLATVTSLASDGRAKVQFYGDSAESGKLYPYIGGYKPTVNDNVLMVKQGSTYVIVGKIVKAAIGDGYYLTKGDGDGLYLTQAEADQLYMSINATLTTDQLKSGSHTFKLNNLTLEPSGNNTFSIGTFSKKFKEAYIEHLMAAWMTGEWGYDPTSSSNGKLSWDGSQTVAPNANEKVNLGTSAYKMNDIYAKQGIFTNVIGEWHRAVNNAVCLKWSTTTNCVYPGATNQVDLGSSSYQLNNCYAKQFYQNGTAISTSDKRKKKGIKDIAKKYVEFFKKLRPVLFKFKDGESDRTHTGFIAQECEEAAGEAGIDTKDLAFICIDPDGNYGLRYEELIAIQTKVIQDLITRVEALENIVKERSTS